MSGTHYDNPLTISYNLGLQDIAAGAVALAIAPPLGKTKCRIEDIHVAVTEVFNGVTTNAFIRIGTAGDADKFAELDMQAAAATNGYNIGDAPAAATPLKDVGYGGNGVVDLTQEAINQLEVVTVANTGGTPTGIGHVTVCISWW